MVRKYWNFALYTCGIPALAFCVLALVQWHRDSAWMEMLRKELPQADTQTLAANRLAEVCRAPVPNEAVGEVCGSYGRLIWLQRLAGVTIGGIVLLVVAVRWAGQRSRRDRMLLLKWFRAGSLVMTVTTLLLVVSQGLLLCAVFYYGPSEFLDRILSGLLLMTALGVLIAVYRILRLLLAFNTEVPIEQDGRFLSAEQAPELWKCVEETAAAAGTEAPRNIIVGTSATYFVTEAAVRTSGGSATGRTLYVSVPLCRILSKEEFRAIVGHEMAHFHGKDTEFSRRFYPVFRAGTKTLEAVAGTANSVGGGAYALFPAISMLAYYLESFSQAEAEISRERELVADEAGARVTSPRSMAVALTKIILHDSAWARVYQELLESTTSDRAQLPVPGASFLSAAEEEYRTMNREERVSQLEHEQLEHPTDTHPPLGTRLRALGLTVEDVFEAAGDIRPAEASSALIPNADELERELMPHFAASSERVRRIFSRQQAGFAAMEHYGGILNRSYLIYVGRDGLYGIRFCGVAGSGDPRYFDGATDLLDNQWFTPGSQSFEQAMKESRANFLIRGSEIADVDFEGKARWGMGQIPHAGTLRIRLRNGRSRKFVLLGEAYGDGIRDYILGTCCGRAAAGVE